MLASFEQRRVVMGVHHFELHALPCSLLQRHLSGGHSVASLEDLEWLPEQDAQPSETFLSRLREMFPNDTSWGPVEEYESNNDWGSDVRIWHIGEPRLDYPIDTIAFRYSPTGDPVETLEAFVTSVRAEDSLLFSRELCDWVKPEMDIVCDKLEMSHAFLFTRDPGRALVERAAKLAEK